MLYTKLEWRGSKEDKGSRLRRSKKFRIQKKKKVFVVVVIVVGNAVVGDGLVGVVFIVLGNLMWAVDCNLIHQSVSGCLIPSIFVFSSFWKLKRQKFLVSPSLSLPVLLCPPIKAPHFECICNNRGKYHVQCPFFFLLSFFHSYFARFWWSTISRISFFNFYVSIYLSVCVNLLRKTVCVYLMTLCGVLCHSFMSDNCKRQSFSRIRLAPAFPSLFLQQENVTFWIIIK